MSIMFLAFSQHLFLSTGAVKEVIVKEFDLPTNKDTRLWYQSMGYYYVEAKGVYLFVCVCAVCVCVCVYNSVYLFERKCVFCLNFLHVHVYSTYVFVKDSNLQSNVWLLVHTYICTPSTYVHAYDNKSAILRIYGYVLSCDISIPQ